MNDLELRILDQLAEVWNNYIKLTELHPSEKIEFMHKLHDLQIMIMARAAYYTNPELFKVNVTTG
jgi:hypothetical protein